MRLLVWWCYLPDVFPVGGVTGFRVGSVCAQNMDCESSWCFSFTCASPTICNATTEVEAVPAGANGDTVCVEAFGCTDTSAANYDPTAKVF